jgi:hypothetical protein
LLAIVFGRIQPNMQIHQDEDNNTAGAFSRLHRLPSVEGEDIGPTATSNSAFAVEIDDEELLQCFLLHPEFNDENDYLLDYAVLRAHQQQYQQLLQARQASPLHYPVLDFHGINLICYQRVPNEAWQIAIPTMMLDRFIN